MHLLGRAIESIADANGFSGVVRVDCGDEVELPTAHGLAHRAYEIPNTVDTQFAIASGTKGLTAVAVASLIEDGSLDLSTTARSVLGQDLPLIGDDVTIEHLLSRGGETGREYAHACPCIVRCGWRSLRRLSRGIWRRVASFHSKSSIWNGPG